MFEKGVDDPPPNRYSKEFQPKQDFRKDRLKLQKLKK
jgi:hypothetical protein